MSEIKPTDAEMAELLNDAWKILRTVETAVRRLRLDGQGANLSLPDEVRMLALAFSEAETPKFPEHVILTGNGASRELRARLKAAAASLPAPPAKG